MQKIIAANWKMYKTRVQASETVSDLCCQLKNETLYDRNIVIFPSFTNILPALEACTDCSAVAIGAQNFYPAEEGAFTGEVSLTMLRDIGVSWVLAGHSERRHLLGEVDEFVAQKTAFALAREFSVMLCLGETLAERARGDLAKVLLRQVTTALADLPLAYTVRLAIAYEPVWAIGTGKVASLAEVLEAHAVVRAHLVDLLGEVGSSVPVLYGGSVKPENASTLLGLDNVDGLLVGGASLNAQSFLQIVRA